VAIIRYHTNKFPVEDVIVMGAFEVEVTGDDYVTWVDDEGLAHAIPLELLDEIIADA
jgi:hypothetical protein